MSTRRSRIVVKPNIKPLGIKATSHAKAKPTSKDSVSDSATVSTQKQVDSFGSQPESSAPTISNSKQVRAPDKAVNQKDATDSTVHEISVRGSKRTDQDHDCEVSNNKSRVSSKDIPGPEATENWKKADNVSAVEPISTSSKLREPVIDHGNSTHPIEDVQPSPVDKLSHSKVVAPKSASEVSSLPDLSQLPSVGETVTPVELEPVGSNQKGNEAAQTKVPEGGHGPEQSSQDACNEETGNDQEDEIHATEKRKRPRGREKKERSEPLPPSDRSPDRQKMKMSDLLSWNPSQNFLPKKKKTNTSKVEVNSEPTESSITMEDETSNQSASLPAPQVMIGSDGNIVLNTESLMVGAPKNGGPKEIIEENDDDRYLNTNSYRQTTRAKLWTEKEDEKFFLGLSMCGTDFSLMCRLWPKRSRKELKNKFIREERRNRPLVDQALSNRQRYDPAVFEKMAAEEARLQEQEKAEAEKKKSSKQKASVKKEKLKPPKSSTKKSKKQKKKEPESEDEEDDMGDDFDDDDEENMVQNDPVDTTPKMSTAKKKKQPKTRLVPKQELLYPNKPGSRSTTSSVPIFLEDDQTQPTVPPPNNRKNEKEFSSSKTTASNGQTERPHLPHSDSNTQPSTAETGVNSNPPTAGNSFSRLQSIPGSSPIQIVMEGISNPLQGVLIPSHILPHVAPDLGIPHTDTPMQVLLVQEESSAGSMVHVYMVPEGDCQPAPAPVGQGNVVNHNPGGGLTLRSPVPRPHLQVRPPLHPANSQLPVDPSNPLRHPYQPPNMNTSPQVPQSHSSGHPRSQPNQLNPSSQTSCSQSVNQPDLHGSQSNQLNPSSQMSQSQPLNQQDHHRMQSNQLSPASQIPHSQLMNQPDNHGLQSNQSNAASQTSYTQQTNQSNKYGLQPNQLDSSSQTSHTQPTNQSHKYGLQPNQLASSSQISHSQPVNQPDKHNIQPDQLNPSSHTSQS